MRLSQNFSFWESYSEFIRKKWALTAFSKANPKTNRVLGLAHIFINFRGKFTEEFKKIFHMPSCLFAVGSNTQEPAYAGEPWGGSTSTPGLTGQPLQNKKSSQDFFFSTEDTPPLCGGYSSLISGWFFV
jgi:hypothetical protein